MRYNHKTMLLESADPTTASGDKFYVYQELESYALYIKNFGVVLHALQKNTQSKFCTSFKYTPEDMWRFYQNIEELVITVCIEVLHLNIVDIMRMPEFADLVNYSLYVDDLSVWETELEEDYKSKI